jgi:ABC-type sugar transport system substrate-binding protein
MHRDNNHTSAAGPPAEVNRTPKARHINRKERSMKRSFSYLLPAACATVLLLAGCGGTSGGSTKSGKGTVSVDIGTGTRIKLPKGKLKIGVFTQGQANQFNEVLADGATKEAAKYDYDVTIVGADFDLNKQMNQLQNAATNKSFDAIILEPISATAACTMLTKTLPAANVLTVTAGSSCDKNLTDAGEDLWVPGTLASVAGDTTITYVRKFLEIAAERHPGPQKVAFATGPDIDPLVIAQKKVVAEMAKSNPDFHVDFVYGDWSTPTALSATQNYLTAHKDTTLLLSAYSPDITRGVIAALTSTDQLGKIPVLDQGGTSYSVEQIKDGNIDFTMPYFPSNYGAYAVKAIHDAQTGAKISRFVSVVPPEYGTVDNPTVVDSKNLDSYTPAY